MAKQGKKWTWNYLHKKFVRMVEIPDLAVRIIVERALIMELNPTANRTRSKPNVLSAAKVLKISKLTAAGH